jgi:hypothetical protein
MHDVADFAGHTCSIDNAKSKSIVGCIFLIIFFHFFFGFGGSVSVGGFFVSFFFCFYFFSTDGILEERGTSMAG